MSTRFKGWAFTLSVSNFIKKGYKLHGNKNVLYRCLSKSWAFTLSVDYFIGKGENSHANIQIFVLLPAW